MALRAVVYVWVPEGLPDELVTALRERFPAECGLTADDLCPGGPLVPEPDEWALPALDGAGRWYEANLYRAFWSPAYPRGDPAMIVRVAEWLETNVPGGQVWYGNDASDHVRPLGPESRRELLASAREAGGRA